MDNIFQSDIFFEFLGSLSFLEAFKVEVKRECVVKGRIVGYIQKDGGSLKQFLSRRAIVNGGPMLADDITEMEIEELLHKCVETLRHKAIYIEFRNYADYTAYREVFERCGFEYKPHYNFQIDTSSEETMLSHLGKSRKRDIKTSYREGATVVGCPTVEDVKQLYEILKRLYTTKVKTPLFPFELFDKLFLSSMGVFKLVSLNGEIIGGTVCVGLPGAALYEWFACGKDGVYKNIYPSTLATFSGMEYAAQNGHPVFDMMGAGSPNDGGYGVRDFKAKFGGKLVEQGRFIHICHRFLYQIGKAGVCLIKHLS